MLSFGLLSIAGFARPSRKIKAPSRATTATSEIHLPTIMLHAQNLKRGRLSLMQQASQTTPAFFDVKKKTLISAVV